MAEVHQQSHSIVTFRKFSTVLPYLIKGDLADTTQCPKEGVRADPGVEIRQPEKVWSLPARKTIPTGNASAKAETLD